MLITTQAYKREKTEATIISHWNFELIIANKRLIKLCKKGRTQTYFQFGAKVKGSTPRITFHVSNKISRESMPHVSSSLWLFRTDLTASDVKAESRLTVP